MLVAYVKNAFFARIMISLSPGEVKKVADVRACTEKNKPLAKTQWPSRRLRPLRAVGTALPASGARKTKVFSRLGLLGPACTQFRRRERQVVDRGFGAGSSWRQSHRPH